MLIILGGDPIRFGQRAVESIVDFQDPEMLEILFNTIHRQDLFNAIFPFYDIGLMGYPAGITLFGINLADPSGIAV